MTPQPEELATALASLAPPDVVSGARRISGEDERHLHEVEATHVERAVAKRRHEYASGRRLLRELLASDAAIPTAADRKPVLPAGTVGSLAHDSQFVVAAVAAAGAYRSLGIDVEPDTPLDASMTAMIVRDDETLDAHLAFTLKEAVYKAWSAAGGPMLEHHDVRITAATAEADSEPAPFQGEIIAAESVLSGRFTRAGGRWLALVTVPHDGDDRR